MLVFVKALIKKSKHLGLEERNLLSVAYKNAVGPARTSWRIMDTIEKKEKQKADSSEKERNLEHIRQSKQDIENELLKICMEIIQILEHDLIPNA